MAILNKIRQKTVVLILVIALALFAFILSSLFDNKDALFGKSQDVVATINGKDISRVEFMSLVEQQQQQMGANATSTQVMNRVFDAKVREAVMEGQFEKLGLSIETDQMRDILKNALSTSPEFLNEAGIFDESKLKVYIDNLKSTSAQAYQNWVNYEQQLAVGALQTDYFNMVKAGATATLAEGELDHKLANDKVDIKYVQVPYSSIADSTVKVSKSEIKDYISKHKKSYETEASRSFQYVFFKEEASAEDEKNIQNSLKELLNDREVYDENAEDKKRTEIGFINTKDVEDFVNANSDDIKYNDRFLKKSALPETIADTIFNQEIGFIYGPYKEGNYYKLSKLVDRTTLPDSAKTRHILIPFIGASRAPADAKPKAEAEALADSLLTVLKSDKSKFSEFVTEYSTDQGSVNNEGRYDWFAYDRMVPEFRDFAFEGKTGDLGVVETAFGLHIIEVEGQKGSSDMVKVATIARKIEPSEDTNDKIFRDASTFEVNLENADFATLAKESSYDVRPMTAKELDESIPGIGNQRQIVRWAFEEGTDVGDYKRFTVSGGIVIAQLTSKSEAGLMSVEDASVTALPEIRKEKKAKLIMDRVSATTLEEFAKAENQNVRSSVAINMKNPTISGAGNEPMVVGTAFGLNEGETSGLVKGNTGVFMVQTTKKTPATELENYQPFANQVSTQKLNSVQNRLYNALKEAAEIEDNRANTVQ
ncbi:parvulin-like peptidyl-prolyl isomerase [Mesoflavibacter sabulilitoris]|uniref:Periplasmic chaperone PpiD n=1 Tax=Mesoflavibacter zeaxanthinifaciens subsp. sabulilitoris TaxID=1520893 RepID=A0A2T1N7J7_9FLAO|nr:peptidylprolyl isomerase [Mesoflavibacter zeaxanthinifaciens]MBB3123986.1 parvulin-like peptidyl-prolyl isomerase [Mesoflavibacter zeaxanthinifaciens subsp. sabulilitoris]MCP4053842.1 peptidylprolyl isomerase [Mesoflavibacter sp.]PSG87837.1 peptidylprolyl isomerase [Mesoflavibacter zeaxanthinifaciens subsp. sabulilitoris]